MAIEALRMFYRDYRFDNFPRYLLVLISESINFIALVNENFNVKFFLLLRLKIIFV